MFWSKKMTKPPSDNILSHISNPQHFIMDPNRPTRSPNGETGGGGPRHRPVAVRLMSSWNSYAIFLKDGGDREMMTSRVEIRRSPLHVRRESNLFGNVPLVCIEQYIVTSEYRETPGVELIASVERRTLKVTFTLWEETHRRVVALAAGSFGIRTFFSFIAETQGSLVLFESGVKYSGEFNGIGPYELLPNESPVEVIL